MRNTVLVACVCVAVLPMALHGQGLRIGEVIPGPAVRQAPLAAMAPAPTTAVVPPMPACDMPVAMPDPESGAAHEGGLRQVPNEGVPLPTLRSGCRNTLVVAQPVASAPDSLAYRPH
jgi:hypothetical protein